MKPMRPNKVTRVVMRFTITRKKFGVRIYPVRAGTKEGVPIREIR